MSMQKKLIERLAEEGKVLISDLHERKYYKLIISLLYRFGDEYPLCDWNEAIRYILCDENLCFYSKEEIVLFINEMK